jgi:hypothetical protein
MRLRLAAAAGGAAFALASGGVQAADLQDFEVRSTAQLAALCGAGPSDELYVEAIQFCYGYLSGAAQFHNAVVGQGGLKPLACPTEEPNRSEFAQYFAGWARNTATPAQLAEPAVQGLARAAVAKWPCPR